MESIKRLGWNVVEVIKREVKDRDEELQEKFVIRWRDILWDMIWRCIKENNLTILLLLGYWFQGIFFFINTYYNEILVLVIIIYSKY